MKKRSPAASPTEEFYTLLGEAFDHFNNELFNGSLPRCLLTVQRETNTLGYFSAERWGHRNGQKAHEIAINPAYFASHTLVEVLQTLVHEQCHLWQQVFGSRKSRQGYHNREWALKMESIGLMPSQTGLPGGKKTGQQMSDYPLGGGAFLQACRALVKRGYQISWVDRIPAISACCQVRNAAGSLGGESIDGDIAVILGTRIDEIVTDVVSPEQVMESRSAKNKSKYSCPACDTNLWGKPGLRISCDRCRRSFVQIS